MTMIQHLSDILVAAGVPLSHQPSSDEAVIMTMEIWIGLRQELEATVVEEEKVDIEPAEPSSSTTGSSSSSSTNNKTVGAVTTTTTTVDDCLPLSDKVIAATRKWLISSWNDVNNDTVDGNNYPYGTQVASRRSGSGSSTEAVTMMSSTTHRNIPTHLYTNLLQIISTTVPYSDSVPSSSLSSFQKQQQQQQQISSHKPLLLLEQVIDSIRATKYLRIWMEVTMNETNNYDSDHSFINPNDNNNNDLFSSLSRHLLCDTMVSTSSSSSDQLFHENVSTTTTTTIATASVVTNSPSLLIQALFHHVQNLPILQQQILSLTQHLQRTTTTTVGSAGMSSHIGTKRNNNSDDPHTMVSLSSVQVAERIQQYEHTQFIVQHIQNEFQQHLHHLEFIIGDFYAAASKQYRCYIRQQLGQFWTSFVRNESFNSAYSSTGSINTNASIKQENTKAVAIRLTLNVLRRILLGMSSSSTTGGEVRDHLLFQHLIPLHEVNGVVLWRDQVSMLELYHEPLCQCIAILIQQELVRTNYTTTIIFKIIQLLLQQPNIFPKVGSTSKQVLLLHEIDTYLRFIPSSRLDGNNDKTYYENEEAMLHILFQILARCMSSEHSRVAERALQFFKSSLMDIFMMKSVTDDDDETQPQPIRHNHDYNVKMCLRTLLPSLIRTEPSWNPTVRKMTYHVIKKLQSYDDEIFITICDEIFAHYHVKDSDSSRDLPTTSKLFSEAESTETNDVSSDFSLKAGMGNWRPPTSSVVSNVNSSGITGRGMAPWTNGQQKQLPSLMKPQRPTASGKSNMPPPSTITGIAPWAVQQSKQILKIPIRASSTLPKEQLQSSTDNSTSELTKSTGPKSGFHHVLTYIEKMKPPIEEEGVSSWSQEQMAETPTLLPNLKFHDLVFGHDLGTGAFGSVKYARLIDKTKSRSYWPEYAVKVVSTKKIYEMGYEISIQREIAVLHLLSHPGIARLISSFRFNDGAYLVLEYANHGDLHSLLLKHGSLDIESTRFVIGEIVATLSSIHDLGFVYGDLKPENIVITEPGHIKLTDFGGCRPITKDAKRLVATITKDMLKNLRSGDWKDKTPLQSSANDNPVKIDEKTDSADGTMYDDEWVDDIRVEGTTAYLPPEVIMGGFPTFSTDAWALGCVTYQCLTGRPPLLEADDGATRNRIVSFDVGINQAQSDIDQLFLGKHATGVNSEARDMIKTLLDRDPLKRPGMTQLAEYEFFSTNVFSLHSQPAYPLDVGTVGPTPNAQWARRQFSSIWAPQPETYNISIPTNSSASFTRVIPLPERPIAEGDEASGFFSATGKLNHAEHSFTTGKRTRKVMLPPSYE